MYIHSDFAEEQQEDRRKKGSIAPWLIGGGLVATGGLGLAMASKAGNKSAIAKEIKQELVNKSADDAKKLISGLNNRKANSEKVARRRALLAEVKDAGDPEEIAYQLSKVNQKDENGKYYRTPLYTQRRHDNSDLGVRVNKRNAIENKKLVEQARELAKSRGLEYSMRYTTTANFAMAGTMGGLKSGVLSKITGDLGQTVQKAKNWLQKAGQAKQEVAATGKRIITPSPYAPQLNKVVKPSSYDEAVRLAKEAQQRLNKNFRVKDEAALRTNLTAGAARQINRGAVDSYSKSGSKAIINDNRSLRLKYTRDPVTGALVSAAYKSPISFLCDL